MYASHHSIMFSRKACYFFVRPRRNVLELCIFLGRTLKAPQIRRVMASSKAKKAHMVHVRHRDEVEPPITDWLQEAYESSDHLTERAREIKRSTKKAPRSTRARPLPRRRRR